MVLQSWQDHYLCCGCSSKPCLCVCVCVCEGGIHRAAQWSLSSLMRLHCPNLTANPIVMLCTLTARERRGSAEQGSAARDPLVWCLLKPDRRGWRWIFLGIPGLGVGVTMQERAREPNPGMHLRQGAERSPWRAVRHEQLGCFLQCYATALFPNNITSVMFKFIPNLVYVAAVSLRNHV